LRCSQASPLRPRRCECRPHKPCRRSRQCTEVSHEPGTQVFDLVESGTGAGTGRSGFVFTLGATSPESRYTDLNHKLMCTCSCAKSWVSVTTWAAHSPQRSLRWLAPALTPATRTSRSSTALLQSTARWFWQRPRPRAFDMVAWIARLPCLPRHCWGQYC